VRATLRAYENETRNLLVSYAERLVIQIAKEYGLEVNFEYIESFAATHNDEDAWNLGNEAAKRLKLKTKHIRIPFQMVRGFWTFFSPYQNLTFWIRIR
jgi:metal-dependent amidase/aminoacylase/carboxypeptidase family protein